MERITSYNIKDCAHLRLVPVIISFDTSGQIKPLYIRINDESFKVYKSVVIEKFHNQTTFLCEVADGEYIKEVKLTYFANESLWAIPSGQNVAVEHN